MARFFMAAAACGVLPLRAAAFFCVHSFWYMSLRSVCCLGGSAFIISSKVFSSANLSGLVPVSSIVS